MKSRKIKTPSSSVGLVGASNPRENPQHQGQMEKRAEGRKCTVPGCDRKHVGLGFCMAHWQRHRNTGLVHPNKRIGDKYGSYNPRWKGGVIDDGHGRMLVYSPDHPNPSRCGTHVYRYRLVMEKQLGRFLRPDEIVHHKNGICDDDRPENLEVMKQSEHAKLHSLRRNPKGQFV